MGNSAAEFIDRIGFGEVEFREYLRSLQQVDENAYTAGDFSREEYQQRLHNIQTRMTQDGLDLLILTSPEAMCYLHGYTSRWYSLNATSEWAPLRCSVIKVDSADFIHFDVSSSHHAELLRRTSIASDVRLCDDETLTGGIDFIRHELKSSGWLTGSQKVGIEMSGSAASKLVMDALIEALEKEGTQRDDITDATAMVRAVRWVKSPTELEYTRKAAQIVDSGISYFLDHAYAGMTELEASALVELGMAKAGGEPPGLHSLVVIGFYVGHSISTRRKLEHGQLISLDPCGVYNRYHANIEVTCSLGEPPEAAQELAHRQGGAFALLAQRARPGVSVESVMREMRDYYESTGMWNIRDWIGGYELGISFPPDWVGEWVFDVEGAGWENSFEANTVTNFEASAPLAMNDTVIYGETQTEILSRHPHEILVIREG